MRELFENLEKEINVVLERISLTEPGTKEYCHLLKAYEILVKQHVTLKTQYREDAKLKINEVQSEADRNSREWIENKKAKTGIAVALIGAAASTIQVVGICFKENIGIVASKAFNFVLKKS